MRNISGVKSLRSNMIQLEEPGAGALKCLRVQLVLVTQVTRLSAYVGSRCWVRARQVRSMCIIDPLEDDALHGCNGLR